MISLDSKTNTAASSSPLSIAPSEEGESKGLSFSDLLRGVSSKKDDKVIQNGALILALDEEIVDAKATKGDGLLALLKGELKEELPAIGLNPEALKGLNPKELKSLIKDAKNYLRDKIIASEGFKKSEIESLPKTLKGLTQVAQKFGINISKITLEEVRVEVKQTSKLSVDLESTKEVVQKESRDVKEKITTQSIDVDNLVDLDTENKKQIKKIAPIQTKQELEDLDKREIRADKRVVELPKEIKTIPLFKAQVSQELTTQQLVNAKLTTVEVKTPKQKADETLKMLLRGDKVSKKESGFTADFSVATARVLAPTATTQVAKNLESLLRGDQGESGTTTVKTDGLILPKADSFDIKLHEAKQMTKYLSQDVKTAIEDYKSPFTRVKVALNPQRLGAIELTVVQRGKNLHINLSSNNAAINALSMNMNDLKVQLTNNGINNASLNFSNNSQSSEQSFSGQQQQSQQRQEADKEYNYFGNEEVNEEIINSLEIVVPHYA